MTDRRHRPAVGFVLHGALNNPELVADVLEALSAAHYRIVPSRPAQFENPMLVVREGAIGSRTLIEAAALFDQISEGELFSAAEFIAWFLPEIEGTPESKGHRVAR
jgi:hypothetical protein